MVDFGLFTVLYAYCLEPRSAVRSKCLSDCPTIHASSCYRCSTVDINLVFAWETSLFSFDVFWQHGTTRVCPPHTTAAKQPAVQQSIDISCHLPAKSTAANSQQWLCCCGHMLGQTDGQTPYHYIDPAVHTMQAPLGSASKYWLRGSGNVLWLGR